MNPFLKHGPSDGRNVHRPSTPASQYCTGRLVDVESLINQSEDAERSLRIYSMISTVRHRHILIPSTHPNPNSDGLIASAKHEYRSSFDRSHR
eukprot:scaffold448119_cov279-Attheya_sp.AAC.1